MNETAPAALMEQLRRHGQCHLLNWWDELDVDRQQSLVEQITAIDFEQIESLLDEFRRTADVAGVDDKTERALPPSDLVRLPCSEADRKSWAEAYQQGEELIAAGKVAAVLVAGGQGTRLGFAHPKGMFPFGPVSGCSLFEILAGQVLARSQRAGVAIPYYIMTSDATHAETIAFFAEHNHFGLDHTDVYFFRQGNMPAVDDKTGRVLMAEKGKLSSSPDGHGGILAAMTGAGLFNDMRNRGIEFLHYHQVDNPTAIVCDPAFIGFHASRHSELSTKVAAKRTAEERMGVVVELDGRTQILEYSDLPDKVARKTDENGELLLWAGNTAIHVFNREFLERLEGEGVGLPFHVAHKQTSHIDEDGQFIVPDEPNAFKFERFIFDALPSAKRALVVEADRTREFNPVKNSSGDDSPETARAAVVSIFSRWLRTAGAEFDADGPIEIMPSFAIDEPTVCRKIEPGTKLTGPVLLK